MPVYAPRPPASLAHASSAPASLLLPTTCPACVPCPRLQVVLAKHSCTVGEVQDVLFSLERAKAIMVEGDDLYLCSA